MRDGRILVTGGAGFIGSALVWGLNRRGRSDILIADVLDRSEKWRNLAPLSFADYIDAADLRLAVERGRLKDIATVFHLGACSSTTETDTAFLMRNNFEYTKVLAEWALAHAARFVYASSAATYGALEGTLTESVPLETLRPLNPYGYSKHLFDRHAQRLGYLDQIVGLKYFNIFGPNEAHKGDMRSMVSKSFDQISTDGTVRLFRSDRPAFRDGEQRRDFLYVKDAVEMTIHLAATPAAHGLFNVGSGRSSTWLELTGAVFDALAVERRVEFIDMPASLRGQYQYSTCASLTRLHATGYDRPLTPLADAVGDYVRHYLVPRRRLGDEPAAIPDLSPSL